MEKITIYCDGGARGNPGPAAVGVVYHNQQGAVVEKFGQAIGQATNNVAEYQAVLLALKKAKRLFGKQKCQQMAFAFLLDSELLVKQLNHQYKIKEKDLQALFIQIWNLWLDFGRVSFSHVPREQNIEADRLVNRALDQEKSKLF
ncbi:MAG: hypothetical protein COU85_00220 [Candidatus Portnoybacteria bacterium CG10_big_fil_rev_8_21_14_0_10_44_7]|uniref:RNase H type-1 domain-containing protein n=1 Tax=Candidatus Portnoybacteria bacterium CG10_big_fil_rev_8_21_14_0_10_44_7 TaxID=1974816 RepID=A0A2M8KJI1_9BACT|nr:MAG: hypothetical protein COU85_00220 [Candidatus Portnoybacteria bacterium CG10_big_fil_rev_8_21_14_0_10_44_7]